MDDLQKIQAEIAELQKQADALVAQRKASAIEEIKAMVKAYGITLKDLGLAEKHEARSGYTLPVKYRLHDKTWTGRGRKPQWVEAHLAAGGQLEELLAK